MNFEKVTEIVKRIMEVDCLNSSLLNETLELYRELEHEEGIIVGAYIKKNATERNYEERTQVLSEINKKYALHKARLKMAISDKIKQLSFYLHSDLIEKICDMLFRSYKISPIKDVRFVNGNEVAVISEEEIEIGKSFHSIDDLDDELIQEEAYLVANSRTKRKRGEEVYSSPEEVFPELYKKVQENTIELLESLGLIKCDEFINSLKNDENKSVEEIASIPYSKNGEMNIYINETMYELYNGVEKFQMIVTIFPDEIQFYDIEVTEGKWVGKKADSNELEPKNITVLRENPDFAHIKKQHVHNDKLPNPELETEIAIDVLRQQRYFRLEGLLLVYGDLFKDLDYKGQKENKFTISRLKFITAEKFTQLGYDYSMALKYAETIFLTIDEYKKQILDGIIGTTEFPNTSLLGKVKELKSPADIS